MIGVDTSFLCSLYGRDLHSLRALAFVKKSKSPLVVSILNEFEWHNALRLSEFRKFRSRGEVDLLVSAYESDKELGVIRLLPCDLIEVVLQAKRIAELYSAKGGYRSFDILHVAAALHLGAKDFLTFDANQKKLAESEGLKVLL